MAALLDTNKPVKCSYSDCNVYFTNTDLMKSHKITEPNHHYCKRCDVDCEDWEDLLQHKFNAMAPFIIGSRSGEKKKKMKHIVCEFCGEEFKSLGGRELHRTKNHQADQQIICPGESVEKDPETKKDILHKCNAIFVRPSGLIKHLEEGHCKYISKSEFEAERTQKHVVQQIMANPDAFTQNLAINQAFRDMPDKPSLIDDGPEPEETAGGVPLREADDQSQISLIHPTLQPERQMHSLDLNVPMTVSRTGDETWPGLPPRSALDSTLDHIRRLSIGSRSSSIGRTTPPDRSSITSPAGGPSGSYSRSRASQTLLDTASDAGSISSASTAANGSRVWTVSDGSVSTKLFPGAKPTPPTTDWDAVARSMERNSREDDKKNLFRARFWDRTDEAYDPDRFLHSVIGKYCCPFPECEATFDEPWEIETHLLNSHAAKRIVCPSCKKNFKNAAALVQHCEASAKGGKCVIACSEGYEKALDEITGGFLSAQRRHEQEKIWGMNKTNVDTTLRGGANPVEERFKGVMDVKYEAKHPGARR